jgi:hypothetical protein
LLVKIIIYFLTNGFFEKIFILFNEINISFLDNPKKSSLFTFINSKKKKMSLSKFILPSFSEDTDDKIGKDIDVSGRNTLIKTDYGWRVAIAEEPIDATVDGTKLFCVRVDKTVLDLHISIGFTPMETFDSTEDTFFGDASFGDRFFTGCGMYTYYGDLEYSVDDGHNIIDRRISSKAKEIIVILTISNNGTKKEIQFLVDGVESESSDVSEYLEGDRLFPAISLYYLNQQVTTIPIDEIKTRTPEIVNLIKEYQQQQNPIQIPLLPSVSSEINNQVISQLRQRINDEQKVLIQEKFQEIRKSYKKQLKHARSQMKEFRKKFLKQIDDARNDFLKRIDDSGRELQLEREISNKQLELERAEHQKLRDLLQQKKDEMSAMEIYYLKKESGQRREREEEFKVKEEPKENEEEKPIQQNNKKNNKKSKK